MKMLAIDNETFLIERERPFPPVVCTSWCDGGRGSVIPHGYGLSGLVRTWLADPDQHFVGHIVAYDFGTLAASYPELLPAIFAAYKAGRITDTGIRQQLFDIATGRTMADDKVQNYSLARLYTLIFDKPMPGSEHKEAGGVRYRYGELYDVDFQDWPQDAIDYSRADAEATYAIWESQEKAAGLIRDDAEQAYAAFCLALTSAQGMRTDPDRVAVLKVEQQAVMAALGPEMIAAGMLEPQYRGRGKLKRQVGWTKKQAPAQERIAQSCAALGVTPMLTDAGKKAERDKTPSKLSHIAIDRTACHNARDALMLRRAEYVTAEKMLSTYVPFLEAGVDGPITSRFNLAATGRTTSSTPRAPAVGGNMQNAPRKTKRVKQAPAWDLPTIAQLEDSPNGVRECFQARPGKIFLSGDFSGAEMHGLAQVCLWKFGHSTLGETLKAGRDPHLHVARYLEGGASTPTEYDDISARYEAGEPAVEQFRFEAKKANFGFGGAMGVKTFVTTMLRDGAHWSEADAAKLKRAWLAAYPEMVEYFQACKTELGAEGKAVVEFYHSKRLRKVRGLSTICNGYFQAIVADGAKRACNEVIRRCYAENQSALFLCRPVNFIHDELVLEIPDHDALVFDRQDTVNEFTNVMQDEFNELVPDYPTRVDAVLSYKMSKRAKPVHNEQGELVPWLG